MNEPVGQPGSGLMPRQGSPTHARQLGIIGAVLLLVAYALPEHGSFHGVWISLLLGPIGGGFTVPLQYRIFIPLRPIGILAALLYVSIARGDRSKTLLAAGVMIGLGVAETLFFITLLGEALVTSLTIWIGLLGAVVVLIAGITAWRERELNL